MCDGSKIWPLPLSTLPNSDSDWLPHQTIDTQAPLEELSQESTDVSLHSLNILVNDVKFGFC